MTNGRTRLLGLGLCCMLASLDAVAGTGPASSAVAEAAIAESTSAILQGDSRRAVGALSAVPAEAFAGRDAVYRACMIARHGDRAVHAVDAIPDGFVREVLRAYQDYWWHAMQAPPRRGELEAALLATLRRLVGPDADGAADFEALEPVLQGHLLARGYHSLLGRTSPLRELMLWRRQESRPWVVSLPEGEHAVRVELLDDFASRGWTAYGRCERGSAGGWATTEALYAVVPSYTDGLDGETFQIVFLGHEAQHFADLRQFPGIQPWELEYRAKLVELARTREISAKRLAMMITAQGDDMESPHTYANTHVVADLTARLGEAPDRVDVERLQEAALALLLEDTRKRRATR